ncbi:hypothetical protein I8752_03570 [Nostocaceae cyanobacterium CENA369]|jgi:uncharacterized HAD superfamily protein|uniref:Uncharacterized protein n=1 Tax=Dendronalium phyllosphericum CENA369 TaxID=1725256 RepID=A0A8J7LCM9_9NOST|nr:hypothetical protein [Dendronalium phyllosphericum]MBH8572126.1 hypothetical protein [Dendronalium phyllosphericum CENA369]
MIAQNYDATDVENNLLRQIKVKENQLKIAQESNMFYVAEALQSQLSKLKYQLFEMQDPEFQALMSLVDEI